MLQTAITTATTDVQKEKLLLEVPRHVTVAIPAAKALNRVAKAIPTLQKKLAAQLIFSARLLTACTTKKKNVMQSISVSAVVTLCNQQRLNVLVSVLDSLGKTPCLWQGVIHDDKSFPQYFLPVIMHDINVIPTPIPIFTSSIFPIENISAALA